MELLKRVLSAFVLIGIVLGCVFIGELTTVVLACLVCVLMMLDVTNVLKQGGNKPQQVVLLLTSICVYPAVSYKGLMGYFLLAAISFAIITICVIFNKEHDFKSMLSSGFCLIYPLIPGALLVYLTAIDLGSSGRVGTILCIGAILCAALSDTFAFFGGKLFGKRKLCPQISPKKTIAGSIASFFGGALGGLIMYMFFKHPTASVHMYDWIFIGVACGGFAQIGDLTASMLKRFCDVKDYGKYIPGHGGIMDRMDSISTCLIAIVVYIQIFIPEIL